MKFFILLSFLYFYLVQSHIIRSSSSEWSMLKKITVEHVVAPNDIDLAQITDEVWDDIVSMCPTVPNAPRINVFFDYLIENTTILAYASQTLHLSSEGVWVSTLYEAMKQNRNYSLGSSYDMEIGFNPNPPNGWHIENNCTGISARYDLRTVLRHELLHGFILAGSIREDSNVWTVGYTFNGVCYPRLYDTLIMDKDNNTVVNGCQLDDVVGKDLFIGNVELFHPYSFWPGSSISHHNYPGNLMYYALPSMTCLNLGDYEGHLLAKLDVACVIGNKTFENSRATKNTYCCLYVVILILIVLLC